MREIKFRAWDKDNDQMITGFGLTPDDLFPYIIPKDDLYGDPTSYSYYDNAVLMQYTGLKDKDGKEIYEGDIVTIGGWDLPMTVGFHDGSFTITNPRAAVYHYITAHWVQNIDNPIEVIGNIYENPELMEEE